MKTAAGTACVWISAFFKTTTEMEDNGEVGAANVFLIKCIRK